MGRRRKDNLIYLRNAKPNGIPMKGAKPKPWRLLGRVGNRLTVTADEYGAEKKNVQIICIGADGVPNICPE